MVITAEKIRPLFCHHSYCDVTLIRDLRVLNLLTFSSDKVKYHEVLLVPIDLEVVVERQLGKVAHLGLDGVEVEVCKVMQGLATTEQFVSLCLF